MAQNVIVIGLGIFGTSLVDELSQLGYEVLAIDRRAERVKEVARANVQAIQGDATSKLLWQDLDVSPYQAAVIAYSSNVEASVLTAVLLRRLKIPTVIAKSNGEEHSEVLLAVGVDTVVQPQEEAGRRLAHTIGAQIIEYMDVAEDYGIAKIYVPPELEQRTCGEIDQRHKVTVLAIKKKDSIIVSPGSGERVQRGDVLILAGKDAVLRRLGSVSTNGELRERRD